MNQHQVPISIWWARRDLRSMPASIQERANCVIGRDYPLPIVDHALARQRALAAYPATTRGWLLKPEPCQPR